MLTVWRLATDARGAIPLPLSGFGVRASNDVYTTCMIRGTDDLLRMNFAPVNPETLQSECKILRFVTANFTVSVHPFAVLPKAALLTTETVTDRLTCLERNRLHAFLLRRTARPSRLPRQISIRELLSELSTPHPPQKHRAIVSPVRKQLTPWSLGEVEAAHRLRTCNALQ